MKKNILIIGLSSFIGTNLAVFLKKKNYLVEGVISANSIDTIKTKRLIFLKKNNIKILKKNLLYKKNVKDLKRYDVIINAIGWTKNYNNNNFDSTIVKKKYLIFFQNLKHYLSLNSPDLFIEIGSSLEYGKSLKKLGEKSKLRPKTKYGILKLQNSNYLEKISKDLQLPVVILRIFSIFGHLDREDKLVEYIKYQKQIIINNPYLKQDFISIDYLSKIVLKILKKKKLKNFAIYNCSSGLGLTPLDIINLLPKKALNKKIIKLQKTKNKINYIKDRLLIGNNRKVTNVLKIKKYNALKEIKNYLSK